MNKRSYKAMKKTGDGAMGVDAILNGLEKVLLRDVRNPTLVNKIMIDIKNEVGPMLHSMVYGY